MEELLKTETHQMQTVSRKPTNRETDGFVKSFDIQVSKASASPRTSI